MRLVSISDGYIEFLREKCPNVMDNKYEERKHTRKYLGVILTIGEFNYFAPLSSPKPYDYKGDGSIRKSDLFCSRMVLNDGGVYKLYGKIMYKNMIPVLESVITIYSLDDETDEKYKALVQNELVWISLHIGEIKEKAAKIYRYQHDERNMNDPRRSKVVNFSMLEDACRLYKEFVK